MQRICETCGGEFSVDPYRVKQGFGKYCSRDCYWEAHRLRFTCEICGKKVVLKKARASKDMPRFCSNACRGKAFSGENHPNYKGGTIHEAGYRRAYVNGKQLYEQRLVAAAQLGSPLDGCIVHHIDEDKLNNDPSNLMIFEDMPSHMAYHRGTGPPGVCVEDI